MAQYDRVVVLGRMEASYGVDPIPAAATHAILMQDVTWTCDAEEAARPMALPHHGNDPFSLVAHRCGLAGSIDLAGAGAAGLAPAWSPFARSCGLAAVVVASTSVTYVPISTGFESEAFYHFLDGSLHKGFGVRGDFSLELAAKAHPRLTFTLMGLYVAPSPLSLPTPTLTAFKDPVPVDFTNTSKLSIGATELPFTSFRYTHGNQVTRRELPGARSVIISGRTPSLEFTVEAPDGVNPDLFALRGTVQNLAVQHGQTAGNIIQIAVRARIQGNPRYSRGDEGQTYLTFSAKPEPTLAGNDEFAMVVR